LESWMQVVRRTLSALGHKRTSVRNSMMSAYGRKTDMLASIKDVRL